MGSDVTYFPSDALPETKTEISSHDHVSTTILMTFVKSGNSNNQLLINQKNLNFTLPSAVESLLLIDRRRWIFCIWCRKYNFLKRKTLIYDVKFTPETTYFPNISDRLLKGWRTCQVTYLPKPFLKFQNPPKAKSDVLAKWRTSRRITVVFFTKFLKQISGRRRRPEIL